MSGNPPPTGGGRIVGDDDYLALEEKARQLMEDAKTLYQMVRDLVKQNDAT